MDQEAGASFRSRRPAALVRRRRCERAPLAQSRQRLAVGDLLPVLLALTRPCTLPSRPGRATSTPALLLTTAGGARPILVLCWRRLWISRRPASSPIRRSPSDRPTTSASFWRRSRWASTRGAVQRPLLPSLRSRIPLRARGVEDSCRSRARAATLSRNLCAPARGFTPIGDHRASADYLPRCWQLSPRFVGSVAHDRFESIRARDRGRSRHLPRAPVHRLANPFVGRLTYPCRRRTRMRAPGHRHHAARARAGACTRC